jgi:hypothetical protein
MLRKNALRYLAISMCLAIAFEGHQRLQITDINELDDILWSSLYEHDDALASQHTRNLAQETILRTASTLQRLHTRDAPHLCDLTSALSRLANHGIGLQEAERTCVAAIR